MAVIEVYTDGSCHTQAKVGAWVALIIEGKEMVTLSGITSNTTHNRMELNAVIEALNYLQVNHPDAQHVLYTDSQYVMELPMRKEKLEQQNYVTGKGTSVQNADMIRQFYSHPLPGKVKFIKVKAHLKKSETGTNYNREADKLSRKLVRDAIKNG